MNKSRLVGNYNNEYGIIHYNCSQNTCIIFITQQKHIVTNKQFFEITKDNQHDLNLVNYNKSYVGVNVTMQFGSTIGNYNIIVKVHDSYAYTW